MANADKLGSLTAHLEKTRQALSDVQKGVVPPKHKDAKESYVFFLNKEIMLTERALSKIKG